MYEWDEAKRKANLRKHGLDFLDAYLVYDDPNKETLSSARRGEQRAQYIALVQVRGEALSLVYVLRGKNVRIISFRQASKKERRVYGIQRKSP